MVLVPKFRMVLGLPLTETASPPVFSIYPMVPPPAAVPLMLIPVMSVTTRAACEEVMVAKMATNFKDFTGFMGLKVKGQWNMKAS